MINIIASENDVHVVVPAGRLDATGSRPFEEELRNQLALGHARLVLDLSETRYINSNGLRAMLRARRDAEQQNGALKLCSLNSRLMEIFEMAGFDRVFEFYPTRAEAVNAFGK